MKLNDLLGTEFPIIQGGMANIATGEFAAAVSNAGALGLIGAGGMNAPMRPSAPALDTAAANSPVAMLAMPP